jgi:hypothetical protein
VTPEEVLNLVEYEKVRDARRRAIIAAKQSRRVCVGASLTILFENRDTVLYQVQEMIRTERIVHDERIQDELDAYNPLVPAPGELSATLFIEIPELVHMSQEEVHRTVNRFQGLDRAVTLTIGEHALPARFEAGHGTEAKMAAVHYVRFRVPPAARQALVEGAPARLVVEHENYAAETLLAPAVTQELRRDLESD